VPAELFAGKHYRAISSMPGGRRQAYPHSYRSEGGKRLDGEISHDFLQS
jgi:hypothetical protein